MRILPAAVVTIYRAPRRILVSDTDEGGEKRALIEDLQCLVRAYASGVLRDHV